MPDILTDADMADATPVLTDADMADATPVLTDADMTDATPVVAETPPVLTDADMVDAKPVMASESPQPDVLTDADMFDATPVAQSAAPLAPLAPAVGAQPAAPMQKIGAGERIRLSRKAETGRDASTLEAIGSQLTFGVQPVVDVINKSALQQLASGKKKTFFRGDVPFSELPDYEISNMAKMANLDMPFMDSPLKQWDKTKGAAITDPKMRRAERAKFIQTEAINELKRRLQGKMEAGEKLSKSDQTLWARLAGGAVDNTGYTLAFMRGPVGAVLGPVARRYGDLQTDEQTLIDGKIETTEKGDTQGTAMAKGAAGGSAEYAIEKFGTEAANFILRNTLKRIPGLGPALSKAGGTAAGKVIANVAQKFKKLGEVTGKQNLAGEIFAEELPQQLVDVGLGLDKRESAKLMGIGSDTAEAFKSFVKPENIGNMALEMLLMQAAQGTAASVSYYDAYSKDRNRLDGTLLAFGANPDLVKKASVEEKRGVLKALSDKLTPDKATAILDKIGKRAGDLHDNIVKQEGYDFDANQYGITSRFALPAEGEEDAWGTLDDGSKLYESTDSGIGLVARPDGTATLYGRDGTMEDFKSVAEAADAANKLSVRDQVNDVRRGQKAKFVESTARRLAPDVNVRVHNTTEDLLEAVPAVKDSPDFEDNPSGIAIGDTIHVVLDNIETPRGVVSTILHEAGVHAGLGRVLKGEAKKQFLGNLGSDAVKKYEEATSKMGYMQGAGNTEEALAYMYEQRLANPTGFQRGISWLHNQLRKVNPNYNFTDSDIEVMLADAQRSVRNAQRGAVAQPAAPVQGKARETAEMNAYERKALELEESYPKPAPAPAKAGTLETVQTVQTQAPKLDLNAESQKRMNEDPQAWIESLRATKGDIGKAVSVYDSVRQDVETSPAETQAGQEQAQEATPEAAGAQAANPAPEQGQEPANAPDAANQSISPTPPPERDDQTITSPNASDVDGGDGDVQQDTLFAEAQETETQTMLDEKQYPTVEYPLEGLELSKDVPQFKEGSNSKTGEVEPLGGNKYIRFGTAPIVVWERTNGRKEIITGRHRAALARRVGEKTIPAQVVREADGFTKEKAITLDAESNIRDGQGSVKDYANYFRNTKTDVQEASGRGLLSRDKGRKGFSIGKYAEDDLYALFSDGKLGEQKAAAIADAAPNNAGAQQVGIQYALTHNADETRQYMNSLLSMRTDAQQGQQLDLLGFDTSWQEQADRRAKAAARIAARMRDELGALKAARSLTKEKRAAIVGKYGFKAGDADAVESRITALEQEIGRFDNWHLNPDLVQMVAKEAGEKPATNDGFLLPEAEIPFNLDGGTQEDTVRIAAEKKAEEDRQKEAKRKLDEAPVLPGIDAPVAVTEKPVVETQKPLPSTSETQTIPRGTKAVATLPNGTLVSGQVKGVAKDGKVEFRAFKVRKFGSKAFTPYPVNADGTPGFKDSFVDADKVRPIDASADVTKLSPEEQRKLKMAERIDAANADIELRKGNEVAPSDVVDRFNSAKERKERRKTDNGDVVRFRRVTPEQDAEYMEAVEKGDRGGDNLVELLRKTEKDERDKAVAAWLERNPETAKRLEKMVDEAAKRAGARSFDEDYPTYDSMIRGVKNGELLVHSRKINEAEVDALQYGLDPTIGETLGSTEAAQTSEEYGWKPVELVFASDGFSWAGRGRNGMIFVKKIGFQKSLGDGKVELEDGRIVRYEMSPVADYENPALKGEPAGVERGDWYSTKTAEVVGVSLFNEKSADPVTYDDQGRVIPLSERFDEKNNDIRFRRSTVTPEQDAAYMAAVERGDMETAQRMVYAAAKAAGKLLYRSEQKKIKNPGVGAVFYTTDESYAKLYHGEERTLKTAFMPSDLVDIRLPEGRALVRDWLTRQITRIEEKQDDGYIFGISTPLRDARRFLDSGDSPQAIGSAMANIGDAIAKERGLEGIVVGLAEKTFLDDTGRAAMTMTEHLRNDGEDFSVAFRVPPSSDPVTYDDQGNLIPLSERFNDRSDDSRFKLPGVTLSEAAREYLAAAQTAVDNAPTMAEKRRALDEWKAKNPEAVREIEGGAQAAFAERYLLSGVVDPSLTSRYATDLPNMAAKFAEEMQAIGAPHPGGRGFGVVRVYPADGAKWTAQNEYILPAGATPVAEYTPAEVRAGKHLEMVSPLTLRPDGTLAGAPRQAPPAEPAPEAARPPIEQARAAVDSVPPKADGSVDLEARQRALDEWKSANPEAAKDADTGEAIQGRAGMRYRSFDSPDEATGIDRSSSTRPFLHGGAYEIEYSGTAKPIGPSQPEGGRGTIDPASVTRVFYEPEYWTPETRAQQLASDLPQLRSMFPNAEFVAVRLADDAETRVASPLALRPDGTLAGVQEQADIRFRRSDASVDKLMEEVNRQAVADNFRALPSTDPKAREIQADVQVSYAYNLTRKTVQKMQDEARGVYEKNKTQAQLDLLAGKTDSGDVNTDARRMAQDKMAVDDLTMDAVANPDDDKKTATAMLGIWRWYERGTDVARAMRLRFDPVDTPEGRRAWILRTMLAPTRKEAAIIQRAKTTADAIDALKIRAKNARKVMVSLKAKNIDISKLTAAELMDEAFVAKIMQEISTARSGWGDVVHEWWRNAILSAPTTQIVNMVGNAGHAALEAFIQRPVEALINTVAKNDRAASFRSISAMYRAIVPSLNSANKAFIQSWKTEKPVSGDSAKVEESNAAIPTKFGGKIIRTPQRLMMATDEWFKTVFMAMLTADYATREFDRLVKEGKQKESNREDYVLAQVDKDSASYAKAWEETLRWSFQQKPGHMAGAIMNWRNDPTFGFLLKFIFPFVKTPANIISTGIRKTPLNAPFYIYKAATGKYSKEDAFRLGAEQAVGMVFMSVLYGMMEGDDDDPLNRPRITGSKKTTYISPAGEKEAEAQDYPPMSVRVGNKWVSYARLEPFATMTATMVDALTAWKQAKDGKTADIPATLFASIRGNFSDKTFLQGVGNMVNMIEGDEFAISKAATSTLAGFNPNIIRSTVMAFDPYVRDTKANKGFVKKLSYQIMPSEGNAPSPKIDKAGQPVKKEGGGVYNSLVPFRVQSADKTTKIDAMVKRYNDSVPKDDRWWPSTPSPITVRLGKEKIELTPEEFETYKRYAGDIAQRRLKSVSFNFDAPTESDMERLKKVYEKARDIAKDKIRPSVIRRFTKSARDIGKRQ